MKVLMLGWELPPHNSGGLGVACYRLCKALSAHGADIDFIVPYTADHGIDFMRVRSATPQSVEVVQRAGIAYDSMKYILKDGSSKELSLHEQVALYRESMDHILQTETYDIIHAHDWLTFQAALYAKQQTGLPLIAQVHATEFDRSGGGSGNQLVREIEEIGLLQADRIIAVSELTRQTIVREYGIPADKISVVHNSIDIGDYEAASTDNAYAYLQTLKQHGWRVVVNVGRLTVQKGLPQLLQAMQAVVQQQPKTMLLVVGSGEQKYELIEMAASLGIGPNVLFADFQRGKRWRDAYAIADLFVMPSVSEPFGLTALEAICYNTPILVSKQSGVAELITHSLQVDFWDIRKMADAIAAVVANDALRDELAANSTQEVKRLSWKDSAIKLADIYNAHTQPVRMPA